MRNKIVIIVVALLLVVCGFSWVAINNANTLNQMTDGWVVDKIYIRPYSYIVDNIARQINAAYMIVVSNGEASAQIEVPEYIYKKYQVGDYLEDVNRELK